MGGFKDFLTGLSTVLPIGGAFGSAALQQSYALKNWERQNAYNHPKEQIKRLKEAGLPLASMFSGSGGSSTSQSIDTPNVDPNLGTAEGLQRGMQLAFQRKQMELLTQNIRSATYDADMKENLRNFELSTTMDSSGGKNIPDFEPQFGDTNQVQGLRRQRAIQESEKISKGILTDLQGIELKVKEELDKLGKLTGETLERVQNIMLHNDELRVRIHNEERRRALVNQVISDLETGGTGWKGLMNLTKAVLFKFLLGQ